MNAFNKDSLMVSVIEKLKKDVENQYSKDVKAQKLVNDLLYHFVWKMAEVHDDP